MVYYSDVARQAARRRRAPSDRELDLIFRALADTTRRRMLAALNRGDATISELAEPFDMSLPAVSKHVRVLEKAGLVDRQIDGRVHRCSLASEPLQDLSGWLSSYRSMWEESLDALARYAERER
jgi:DNA-binding transcriptional ArsR family regulator